MMINSTISTTSSLSKVLATQVEAYRYLFAIGFLHAMTGALVWVLYRFELVSYPNVIHPVMMSGGFLLCFAFGFLWTAVPRFTGTALPTFRELSLLLVSTMAALTAEVWNSELWGLIFTFVSCILSLRFVLSRFRGRTQDPPDAFLFVGSAMLIGVTSLLILIASHFTELPQPLVMFARSFFLKGILIFLVTGVGLRLIPAILGISTTQKIELVSPSRTTSVVEARTNFLAPRHILLFAALITAFVLEALSYTRASATVFLVSFSWMSLRGFHMYRIPSLSNRFALMVWLSVACMNLTPLLILLFPSQAVHHWHLLFIGGFGLMISMVSLRVSVSHSGVAVANTEEKRKHITWIAVLILLAACTRVSIAWLPWMALNHYLYAALLWMTGMTIWFVYFLRYTVAAEKFRRARLMQTRVAGNVSASV